MSHWELCSFNASLSRTAASKVVIPVVLTQWPKVRRLCKNKAWLTQRLQVKVVGITRAQDGLYIATDLQEVDYSALQEPTIGSAEQTLGWNRCLNLAFSICNVVEASLRTIEDKTCRLQNPEEKLASHPLLLYRFSLSPRSRSLM